MEDDYKPPISLRWGEHYYSSGDTARAHCARTNSAIAHCTPGQHEWGETDPNKPLFAVSFPGGNTTEFLTMYEALRLAWMFNTVHKGVDENDR